MFEYQENDNCQCGDLNPIVPEPEKEYIKCNSCGFYYSNPFKCTKCGKRIDKQKKEYSFLQTQGGLNVF